MKIFLLLITSMTLWSCAQGDELETMVANLHQSNDSIRFAAIDNLEKYNPTVKQQVYLLDAAAKSYPKAKYDWQSIPGIIMDVATKRQDLRLLDVIKKNYVRYDKVAKNTALRFLANYPSEKSIELLVELSLKYPKEMDYFPSGILEKDFSFKRIVFPKIVDLLQDDYLQSDVLLLLLGYFNARQLNPADYQSCLPKIIGISKASRMILLREQDSQENLWDNGIYQNERDKAGICADLLCHFNNPDVISELKEYDRLKDCKLKMFASVSLLKLNQPVDKEMLNMIAADAESRKWLYNNLLELKLDHLFPAKYKTQEAFAESDMVNWLLYPTELGRAPDAIELMKVVKVNSHSENGMVEFYLFRFKSNHKTWKDNGWMTGISGFFPEKYKPSVNAFGYTFSAFEKWESKTPEEHVKYIQGLIDDYHNKKD